MKKILLILIMVGLAQLLLAQVPSTISYQGFYTDANGVPINDNASQSHTVKFDFFRGSETNSAFSRTIENVKVTKGLFSVVIGRNVTAEDGALNTPLSIDDIHTNASYSVQVTIDGTVIGNKVPLSAVPYAMTAGKVSGSNVTGTIDAVQVVGSGAGITNLNASNLATGTIADARLEPIVDVGALNVGAGGELAISNTGNITKIKGLAYDFPSSHNTGTTFLSNNGSGTLAWSGLPANVPTGTGATNTVALWSGANALSNDTDLSWDGGTNTLTATNFSGNGAGLTALTAANLTGTNTLPAGVLPTTVPIGNGATDRVTLWSGTGTVSSSANLSWNGTSNTLSATNFSGNGAALTSLTAANITGTNTLPAGVLPTTVPIGNGATNRLTFWSGTGTVSSSANLSWNGTTNTLSANNFNGNGAALTNLNGSSISSGTVPDGNLESIIDRTIFNASDYVTALGGLNIGGSADPNNNLLVSSGSVGIGLSPAVPLHVSGNAGLLRLQGTNRSYLEFYPDGAGAVDGYIGYLGSTDEHLSVSNVSTGKVKVIRTPDGIDSDVGDGSIEMGDNNNSLAENAVIIGSYGQLMAAADGSMLLADNSTTTLSTSFVTPNRFYARFAGGFFLYTNSTQTAGVGVPAGGTSWASISDSTKKENFKQVDGEQVLEKIKTLRLNTWNYKFNDRSIRHYGPMAQEFYRAFGSDGVGYVGTDTTIVSQDIEGVNLTAIKALVIRTDELRAAFEKIKELEQRIIDKDSQIEDLRVKISKEKLEGEESLLEMRKEFNGEIRKLRELIDLKLAKQTTP